MLYGFRCALVSMWLTHNYIIYCYSLTGQHSIAKQIVGKQG